jgi:uncharacterized protein YdhG (YjbR/CyaY superfamily)
MGTLCNPTSIDDYLSYLSGTKRAALDKLRQDIKSAVPKAEECISYRIPTFRLGGKMLVCFVAGEDHCAFYAGSLVVAAHVDELREYETSKGTIRFAPEDPLPSDLVRKLVRTRVAALPSPRPIAAQSVARHRRRVSV